MMSIAGPGEFRKVAQVVAMQHLCGGTDFGMAHYRSGINGPERFLLMVMTVPQVDNLFDGTAVFFDGIMGKHFGVSGG